MKDIEKLGNAETALLGLLAEEPKHAYQIEKDVEERGMRIWTDLSMSSIYKLLNKLEQGGGIDSKVVQSDNNQLRKIYKLTNKGGKALAESLRGIFSEAIVAKNPFDVAIYFSGNLSDAQVVEGLIDYQSALEAKIVEYEAVGIHLKDVGCGPGPQGLAARTVAMLKAELLWLKDHIVLMRKQTNSKQREKRHD
jgi:DNA-binding PadR family transcriptional regulator